MQEKTKQQDKAPQPTSGTGVGVQYLTFILNKETYGINLESIKEIIEHGQITAVPMTTDYIAGVINLRGSVVPVINLARRFSEKCSTKTKRSSIVILEVRHEDSKIEIGITVDVVNEVLDILPRDIEPAPLFGTKIRTDFISGMGKVDDQLLVLLDTKTILSIEELSSVDTPAAA